MFTTPAYKLSLGATSTVLVRHADGSIDDLNADGEPCTTADSLRSFVHELHDNGFYTSGVRDALLLHAESETERWVEDQ